MDLLRWVLDVRVVFTYGVDGLEVSCVEDLISSACTAASRCDASDLAASSVARAVCLI